MTRVTLSQLLCVPTVRMEKFGSVSVWHNDSADAIFIGCCWNISLPCMSPVKNKPDGRGQRDPAAQDGGGPVHGARRRRCGGCALAARTIHHAQTPATNVPAVRKAPATAWVNAQIAVLLVNSATMLCSSARPVSGL